MEKDTRKLLKLMKNLFRSALVSAVKKLAADNDVEILHIEVEERLDKLFSEALKGEISSDDEIQKRLRAAFPELKDFMKSNDFPWGMYV